MTYLIEDKQYIVVAIVARGFPAELVALAITYEPCVPLFECSAGSIGVYVSTLTAIQSKGYSDRRRTRYIAGRQP